MLFLLSPAKSLDFETPAPGDLPHTQPLYGRQAGELVALLKKKSARQLADLMEISPALAELNVARFKAWSPSFTPANSKQALLAFDGDVYDGLDAKTLKPTDLAWAQDHLRILSGLYGVLRPLDYMQPYRLEMGRPLANKQGGNLYKFWGGTQAEHLNALQIEDKTPVVVNLASVEYFKSVDKRLLKASVVECVFEELKNGQYKVISFNAKRARGQMARYAIQKRVSTVAKLRAFAQDGYAFDEAASGPCRLVFRRGPQSLTGL